MKSVGCEDLQVVQVSKRIAHPALAAKWGTPSEEKSDGGFRREPGRTPGEPPSRPKGQSSPGLPRIAPGAACRSQLGKIAKRLLATNPGAPHKLASPNWPVASLEVGMTMAAQMLCSRFLDLVGCPAADSIRSNCIFGRDLLALRPTVLPV